MAKAPKAYKSASVRDIDERNRLIVKRVGQAIVFVITMVSTIASFTAFGVSWLTIAIASFSLVLFLSLLANAMLLFDSRKRRKGPKQIAFLTPSTGGQPFYATMLLGLVQNASRALGQNYIVLPSMPTESFETMSIWALFASLEDRQLDIDGIIFIPDQPDRHFDELVGFHEERGDIPLVLVDVYFDLDRCDDRTRARLPSFVGGDEQIGGVLAAEIAIGSIGAITERAPVVMVVNGGIAPWEQQRAQAFRDRMRTQWPDVNFIETPAINYQRSVAYETSLQVVKALADHDRQISLDVIFACNDDMAIGARGAVSRVLREGYAFRSRPQIVGYDGIPEIREYIKEGDPYIAGTVDVRIEEQARTAMLLMQKLVRLRQRRSEVLLITPEAIRRIPSQSGAIRTT